MKKCNCPFCNKELVRLEPFEAGIYEFWCDNCDADITVEKNDKAFYADLLMEQQEQM